MIGYIHSIQTLGTLDGPGLRTIVFMQGCPFRCKFCHSIDTTLSKKTNPMNVYSLVQEVLKYKDYWGNNDKNITGGVTISGGDPLFQHAFVLEFIKELKKLNIHITLETELFTMQDIIKKFIPFINLWMVSIKHMNDTNHKEITGQSNKIVLENIQFLDKNFTVFNTNLSKLNANNRLLKTKVSNDCKTSIKDTKAQINDLESLKKKIRIRFVVVPKITNDAQNIKNLGKFVSKIKNLDCLELLAYTSLGKFKWIELFNKYELENIPNATVEDLALVKKQLQGYNLNIKS